MAFSFTKTTEFPNGNTRITGGTFANAGGSTGGDVCTGLQKVYGILLQHKGSGVVATEPKANYTFPGVDPVTIVTTANTNGWWLAWGV